MTRFARGGIMGFRGSSECPPPEAARFSAAARSSAKRPPSASPPNPQAEDANQLRRELIMIRFTSTGMRFRDAILSFSHEPGTTRRQILRVESDCQTITSLRIGNPSMQTVTEKHWPRLPADDSPFPPESLEFQLRYLSDIAPKWTGTLAES